MKSVLSLALVSLALAGCSNGNSTSSVAQSSPAPSAPAAKNAEFGEAAALLGTDPAPTIIARAKTCLSGDRNAFAAFYAPELVNALAKDSQILDMDFRHECGDASTKQPRIDPDVMAKTMKVFAKRSELQDGLTGNSVFRLCVTDQDAVHCARPGANWTNSVVVREGRVLFVD